MSYRGLGPEIFATSLPCFEVEDAEDSHSAT